MGRPTVYSHATLIGMAAQWMKSRGLPVVATDVVSSCCETPDAIGFGAYGGCVLCEAKATRSDFMADRKKIFRRNAGRGLGTARYYVVPPGLIRDGDDLFGFGILEARGSKLAIVRECVIFHEHNTRGEMSILVSLLRRIGSTCPTGMAVKHYTYDNPNTLTTLGTQKDTTA